MFSPVALPETKWLPPADTDVTRLKCSSPMFADLHRLLIRVGRKVWASRSGRTYAPLWLCTQDSGRLRGSV